MTDRVVYETTNRPIYVIQFEEAPGEWSDAGSPQYRSLQAAVLELNSKPAAPYPYRIVERKK